MLTVSAYPASERNILFSSEDTMSYDFSGKRALVTGAGLGIGRATAIHLQKMGAQVFALSRTQENLDTLKAECPAITTICVDVGDWTKTREAMTKILPIHLLVNNAAAGANETVLEAKPESFDRVFNVNVKASINTSQLMANDLLERKETGNIVNVSSVASVKGSSRIPLYAASKAALDSITKSMAVFLGPKGIRTNSVLPTLVETKMSGPILANPEWKNAILSRVPQGKCAQVEDIANAILYLLSDKSDMINGHMLSVDGGSMAC